MLYNAENYRKAQISMDEQYLMIDEVATKLQVSRVTVYSFINSGKLESVKIGKSRRVTATALQRFIKEHIDRKDAKHGKAQNDDG